MVFINIESIIFSRTHKKMLKVLFMISFLTFAHAIPTNGNAIYTFFLLSYKVVCVFPMIVLYTVPCGVQHSFRLKHISGLKTFVPFMTYKNEVGQSDGNNHSKEKTKMRPGNIILLI